MDLNICDNWCHGEGLKISPEKANLVFFPREKFETQSLVLDITALVGPLIIYGAPKGKSKIPVDKDKRFIITGAKKQPLLVYIPPL